MKWLGCLGALALATAPAMAQDLSLAYRDSGRHAGGPARLFYRPNAPFAPLSRTVPPARALRSGQLAGGPAREFIARDPRSVSLEGTVYDSSRTLPFGYARSGQMAGGPRSAALRAPGRSTS
jgi:hypothetical protein